jgi:isoleucyl-tRNA synthetase
VETADALRDLVHGLVVSEVDDATLARIGDLSRQAGALLDGAPRRTRAIPDLATIEALRAEGKVGASLQAEVALTADADDHALLASLGEDLKFVFISSAVTLQAGADFTVRVAPSAATKCERCWHYRDDVGHDPAHPTLCGRCTSNLFGTGEQRLFA